MSKIEIKKAAITDLKLLQEIGKLTFSETFSSLNTDANMTQYLTEGFSDKKLTTELENKNSEFYFALYGGKVIGYLKINSGESQTEIKDKHAIEIERIYILKDYQGKNLGQMLYDKAISIAREKNVTYVWLGVWEENSKAINFYKKNGFVEFDKHIFKLGDDEQIDILMKRTL